VCGERLEEMGLWRLFAVEFALPHGMIDKMRLDFAVLLKFMGGVLVIRNLGALLRRRSARNSLPCLIRLAVKRALRKALKARFIFSAASFARYSS
jgi:hypothetical protein